METLEEVLNSFSDCKNQTIIDNIIIAWSKINSLLYNRVGCSISGGSDSDIMLDIVTKCDRDDKVQYFWFDTGIEYEATKRHIKFLEEKYKIEIVKVRAKKTIPYTTKEWGEPFISKLVSQQIQYLQKHNFDWVDEPFDVLYKKYPNCKRALRWWCNDFPTDNSMKMFNIAYNKYLKEFMIANPPTFKISNKCCDYAKKNVAKEICKTYNLDLMIVGTRKAEGGTRSVRYKNCFDELNSHINCAEYRPLFFYTNKDKSDYEISQNICHSDCYTKYGFKRTGCVGCPYGHVHGQLWHELEKTKEHEPVLYNAVSNVFANSYNYTKQYYEFRKRKEIKK